MMMTADSCRDRAGLHGKHLSEVHLLLRVMNQDSRGPQTIRLRWPVWCWQRVSQGQPMPFTGREEGHGSKCLLPEAAIPTADPDTSRIRPSECSHQGISLLAASRNGKRRDSGGSSRLVNLSEFSPCSSSHRSASLKGFISWPRPASLQRRSHELLASANRATSPLHAASPHANSGQRQTLMKPLWPFVACAQGRSLGRACP